MIREQSTLVEQVAYIICKNHTNQIMLDYAMKNYDIMLYKIQTLHPDKILTMYEGISLKSYHNPDLYNEQFWYQNELKVYIWALVAYSFHRQLLIQNFASQQWLLFAKAFNNRPLEFFQFQANCILKPNKLSKAWANEEEEFLKQIIIRDQISNQWNYVARKLFKVSGTKYYKTPKQCRQKWLNHLDPRKKHSPWTVDQDIELFKCVKSIGKKWAQISKIFKKTRTEHMIKNRFKAIVYSYNKRSPKIKQHEVVEKFLSLYETENKSNNQEKTQKKIRRKQKSSQKDPILVCRVSPTIPSQSQAANITDHSKVSAFVSLPFNIAFEPSTIEQSSGKKQAKAPFEQQIEEAKIGEENEMNQGIKFFEQLDSQMSNIPFLMENEDIESFISNCMQVPGNDYFGQARLTNPYAFQNLGQ